MIEYAPPEPFAPGLSEYYGRSMENAQLQQHAQQLAVQRQQIAAQMADSQNRLNLAAGGQFQQAIENRDRQGFEGEKFAAGLAQQNADRQAAQVLQQDRFGLQAQLHGMELSQQEQMRLQRMKNAVGEVMADPTMTDREKSDMVMQLKTGIDPFENRLKQSRLELETQQKNAMAEHFQAETALRQQRLEVAAKSPEQRKLHLFDEGELQATVADVTEANPGIDQATAKKMAEDHLRVHGKNTQHGYLNDDGKAVWFDRGAGTGRGAGAGRGVGTGAATGLGDEFSPEAHMPSDRDANTMDKEILDLAHKRYMNDYPPGTTPPPGAWQKTVDEVTGSYNQLRGARIKSVMAARTAVPKPFNAREYEHGGTVGQTAGINDIRSIYAAIRDNDKLNDGQKHTMLTEMEVLIDLYGKYSDANGSVEYLKHTKPVIYDRIQKINAAVAQLPNPSKKVVPPAPAAEAPATAGPPIVMHQGRPGVWVTQPEPNTLQGDINTAKQAIEGWQGPLIGARKVQDWFRRRGEYFKLD